MSTARPTITTSSPDNNGGNSANSNTASAQVSLPAPTNLTATPGNGSVTLSFTASKGLGIQYYNVYETTTANAPLSSFTYVGYTTGTTFTQYNLSSATTYY